MSMYPTFENVSEEEYLVREPVAEYKSEYRDGRVFAMSGASLAHNLISLNTAAEIRQQLKGKACQVCASDLRTKVVASRLYTYPDVVVVCGQPRFDERDKYALLNPTVIIEVLSPSTELYDRGEKFEHFKKVDSLREYVLISQDKFMIEHFSLLNDRWNLETLQSPEGILALNSIDCRVLVREIYDKVNFASDAE